MCDDPFMQAAMDRRTSTRQAANIPVAILADDWSVFAILEDISSSGALLLTQEHVEVGKTVDIHVLLGTDVRPALRASATVVRSGEREGGQALWTHEVAVQYESRRGPWEEALSAVAERQAELRRTDA